MRSLAFLVAFFVVAFAIAPQVQAEIDHADIESRFETALHEFEERMRPIWSARERVLWDQTRIDIRRTNRIVAQAGYLGDTDQRVIVLSTGMVNVIQNLAATSVHSNTLYAGPCHFDYLLQVNNSVREDWLANDRGPLPEDFYEIDCSCPRFSSSAMAQSVAGQMMTQGGLHLSLFFILLHEFAHHALGHTDLPGGNRDELELAADRWAIETARRAQLTFEAVVPTFAFVFLVDDTLLGIDSAEPRFENLIELVAWSLDPESGVVRFGPEFAEEQIRAVRSYSGFFNRIDVHRRAASDRVCEPRQIIDYKELLDSRFLHGSNQ